MIRLMNESSSSKDKIRIDIDNIVKNGGDAYDAMDYLEGNGFIEGVSTTMRYPDGNVEITTFYNDENSNMYVAIDHTPLNKGNKVIKVWFGYNESISGNFTESSTRKTRGKRVTESADGVLEPEIVKDRGGKIYNDTIKILDRFGSQFVSASMYAYTLKEKKLADKTLYKLAKDIYDASGRLYGYSMDHRKDYE